MNYGKIKVALISSSNFYDGGSHSYEKSICNYLINQDINSIEFISFHPVGSNAISNSIKVINYKITLITKIGSLIRSKKIIRKILSRFSYLQSPLQKQLISNCVDVAYFLSPNPMAMGINKVPMVNTVWDLGHKELADFPEMASWFHFLSREFFYSNVLPRSMIVVTDSKKTSKSISEFYNIQTSKTFSAGLFPVKSALKKSNLYNSITFPYIIYPANFWQHKNHQLLINLMDICKREFPSLKLILTGSNKGNLENIKKSIQNKDLKNIEILGFVDSEVLTELTANALALIFPSRLGPTNLPPLEALSLGTPVIVTKNNSDLVHNPSKGVWVVENDLVESFQAALRGIIQSNQGIVPWDFSLINHASAKGIIELIIAEYLKINWQFEANSTEQSFLEHE